MLSTTDEIKNCTEHRATLEQPTTTQSLSAEHKAFNETYKEWIAEQNRLTQEYGVFGESHRVW